MNEIEKKVQFTVNLFKSKKYTEAQIQAEKLLVKYPKIIFLYNILGLILTELNEIDKAISIFKKGILINPKSAIIYNNLGTAYKICEDYISSEKSYEKSLHIDRNISETHNNFGNLCIHLNRHKEGIKHFEGAILVNSKFYIAYYNLGIVYKSMGRFDDAKKYLNETIKLNPNFYTAHRILSQLIKYKKDEKHLIILQNIFDNKKNEKISKAEIAFALGKAYEDICDFNKSYKYFNIGNKKKRESVNFSLKQEKNNFNNIKKVFNKKLFLKLQNTGLKNSSMIFIVGMPRSGSTLIEQIVSNHDKVFGGDELNILSDLVKSYFYKNDQENLLANLDNINRNILKDIGEDYITKLKKISKNSPIITDKNTSNFIWIGLIKLILPNSKIINCKRDSSDVCFSIFKNYFTNTELNYAYDVNEVVEYHNLYSDLMNYWHNTLPNFVYDIQYEKLINKPEHEIKNLLKYCNLDWDINCLKFHENNRIIKTASDTQARKKIYNSSIGYWKNFKKEFENSFEKLLS